MILTKRLIALSRYTGKSKFDFWRELYPGAEVTLSTTLSRHAYPKIEYDGKVFNCDMGNMNKYLDKIEFEELPENSF